MASFPPKEIHSCKGFRAFLISPPQIPPFKRGRLWGARLAPQSPCKMIQTLSRVSRKRLRKPCKVTRDIRCRGLGRRGARRAPRFSKCVAPVFKPMRCHTPMLIVRRNDSGPFLGWIGCKWGEKQTPPCRVLLGFEPAFAGGALPTGSALAPAYRVAHLR